MIHFYYCSKFCPHKKNTHQCKINTFITPLYYFILLFFNLSREPILTSTPIAFYKSHTTTQQPSTSFDTPVDTCVTMSSIINEKLCVESSNEPYDSVVSK